MRKAKSFGIYPVYWLFFILFVLLISLPVFYTFLKALPDTGQIIHEITLPELKPLIFRSLVVAGFSALLSVFIGAVLAFALYKTTMKAARYLRLLLLFPLFVSPYIWAVAYRDLVVRVTGNPGLIENLAGVVWVLVVVFSPLVMLMIGSALQNIDSSLEEAGIMLYPSKKVMVKVVFPLLKPALVSAFVLVFIFSLSEFTVAGFYGVKVFVTEIFTRFAAFYDFRTAIAESLFLVILSVALLLAGMTYLSDAPFLTVGLRGTKVRLYKWKWPGVFAALWFVVSVIIPFGVILSGMSGSYTKYLYQAWTLLRPAIGASLKLALIAAVIMTAAGFVYGYFSAVKKIKSSKIWLLLMFLIFALPSATYGISLITFYNRPALEAIYTSFAIIILAYTGKYLFISAKIIENGIKQIPRSLDEAAVMSGAGLGKRLREIWLPLTARPVFVAFIITFLFSLGDLGVTIMVYPPGSQLMPIKVFTVMANAPQGLTGAMVGIVLILTVVIVGFSALVFRVLFLSSKTKTKFGFYG